MCGIFGIFNLDKAAELTVIGLHGNQHRAIDYAGIVSSDNTHFYRDGGSGIARQVFTKERIDGLHGKYALGHIRYPTVTDDKTRDNIQPIVGVYNGKPIAIAHNGNITNISELKSLVSDNLATSMDTEYILRLLEARCTGNIETDLRHVLSLLKGSFALGILLPNLLVAVNDRTSNRPLSIGKLNGGYCISSEDCAFNSVGASKIHDIEAGTMVFIEPQKIHVKRFDKKDEKKCRFEGIYYSHPASTVFGEGVARFRLKIGRKLEELFPVPGADIVTPVPDASNFMAMGYGENGHSGKYFPIITRSHYVGRTFIAANQAMRNIEVSQKFAFTTSEISGKTIVVVDDSIVRCTTMPVIVSELKRLGAKEVHIRIGSPPTKHPCIYGINTPSYDELIAASLSHKDICEKIGADSLEFLPLETIKTMSPKPENFCFACMSGEYW